MTPNLTPIKKLWVRTDLPSDHRANMHFPVSVRVVVVLPDFHVVPPRDVDVIY